MKAWSLRVVIGAIPDQLIIYAYLLFQITLSLDFYRNLSLLKLPINTVLANENNFVDVPTDWHIVIADVINSTRAVNEGRHVDVNFIAAGCLISSLNISRRLNVEIPYFFGGDGGMVLVPAGILQTVLAGLNAHRENSLQNFSLDLRIGSVPVATVTKNGYKLKIVKVEETPGFNKALLIGNGFKYAEFLVKKNHVAPVEKEISPSDLSLEGMECKWEKIRPASQAFEVVCLLVEAVREEDQFNVYSDVLNKLDEVYGNINIRHPLTVDMLKFRAGAGKIKREMLARYSKWNIAYFIRTWLRSQLAKIYFKYDLKTRNLRASEYLRQLVNFSEILTIDGRINTIVSGSPEKRIALLQYLRDLESKQQIVFGHYVSSASIMTCYVQNINNKHVHFIDGADGGYTAASMELKPKLAALNIFNHY